MREAVRDKGRLEHMLSAIMNVEEYTQNLTQDDLVKDKLRLHATVYNIQIIGEATYKLTKEFKEDHPSTPWAMIEKMRHILVHDYYQINNDILWSIIMDDIPALKNQILIYLESM